MLGSLLIDHLSQLEKGFIASIEDSVIDVFSIIGRHQLEVQIGIILFLGFQIYFNGFDIL